MKLCSRVMRLGSAAALVAGLVSAPALANENAPFSALAGVDAQPLSATEMQAIAGELNAYDIAASLFALAARYAAFPRVAAFYTRLANDALANAVQINALFQRLGVLTPCTSTLCPK